MICLSVGTWKGQSSLLEALDISFDNFNCHSSDLHAFKLLWYLASNMLQQLLQLAAAISGAFLVSYVHNSFQNRRKELTSSRSSIALYGGFITIHSRNTPGPIVASLTDWYAAWHAYKGDLHIKMKEAHDQYGMYSIKLLLPLLRISHGPQR